MNNKENLQIVSTYRTYENIEKQIEKIVNERSSKYDNKSHFVRVAIAKLLREEKEKYIRKHAQIGKVRK